MQYLTRFRKAVAISADDYASLLKVCIERKSLKGGKEIHQHILKNTSDANNYRYSTALENLASLYIVCGRVDLAHLVFNGISSPCIILWNNLIKAYAWNGPGDSAIELYSQMRVSNVAPTNFTFPFVLKACSTLYDEGHGEEIHSHAIRFGLNTDVYVSTALVDLYAKCGDIAKAQNVFHGMRCKDVVAWNAMISGLAQHGLYDDVIGLVLEMQKSGIGPNLSTLVSILPAVADVGVSVHGKSIHGYCVRRGFAAEVKVGTGLLDMYGKCGYIDYAETIFYLLGVRNEVTWSAMVGAYVISNHINEALELYDRMLLEDGKSASSVTHVYALRACTELVDLGRGRRIHGHMLKIGDLTDMMISNSTLSMYAKCGELHSAVQFFQDMSMRDRVSYNAIIAGCVQNGECLQALDFFHSMQLSGIDPDDTTMLGVLPACSHLAALRDGSCAHAYAIICGFLANTSICNALIDMYAKCGKVSTAREVFNKMPNRDIVSYNSMIAGYGLHGLGMNAISLFNELITVGLKPNDVTFISLLSACSHSGLVAEGKQLFCSMVHKFCVVPRIDHYICMVDLLGRTGLLDEARRFIHEMPFNPDAHVWEALLAACRTHKNIELGEEASNKIQSLGPVGPGNFVLMSNIYSSAGRWNEAADVRIAQKHRGFNKRPGCSWVEINGSVYTFINGDRSHPKLDQIHNKLNELQAEMKRLGYCVVSGFVLQDVEGEEEEHILLHHSEKLAIAFAIISLSPGKQILVTKNLRVCGDCHDAIKYMSVITKREITVRDTRRFHHFRDGICSCQDFW